jgi:hypothetical protein
MAASIVGENSRGMCAAWRAIPCLNEFYRILDDLWPQRAACSGFLLRSLAAPVIHFALVKAHGRASMDQGNGRIEVGRKQMSRLVRVLDDNDVVELLRSSVRKAGGQTAFASQIGLDRTHLNRVLIGKRLLSWTIIDTLNLGVVYVPLDRSDGLAVRKLRPRGRALADSARGRR